MKTSKNTTPYCAVKALILTPIRSHAAMAQEPVLHGLDNIIMVGKRILHKQVHLGVFI